VRIALGAQRSRVVSGVVGRGMTPVLIGLAIGVAGALLLSKVMTGLLYGIGPTDVVTFVAVTGLLGGVALLAAYVPALRASRVDPIVALRAE
jgi:putative ABC transport system permease protein